MLKIYCQYKNAIKKEFISTKLIQIDKITLKQAIKEFKSLKDKT